MKSNANSLTKFQKRLIDIGFIIQFYLAALGHFVVWWEMYNAMLRPAPPKDFDDTRFIAEIFVFQGLPVSFGFLVFVYILFRCVLWSTKIDTALSFMICFNVIHSLLLCFFIITPARLTIPTLLYAIAYYSYYKETIGLKKEEIVVSANHDKGKNE